MERIPRISESEWRVMKVLWECSPRASSEVVEALAADTQWKPKTIKTLLNRLVAKKAIGFEQDGRAYRYFPLITERDCVREESRSFLQRVHGGALLPMIAAFLEDKRLSDEEIEDLKQILARNGGNK